MSNNKETQEPLMGQPVELEVVGATEATQAAGEASVRPQREEPLKGRKAVRKPAGKEGEAAGEAVEAQGEAREDAATEQPSEEAEAERVAEAIRQAIEEQAREDENPHSTNYTLRQIIGGEMLQTGVMKKNVGLMAVVGLFLFVSVTNRYSVQEKLKEINRLEAKLSDAKYRALSTGRQIHREDATELCAPGAAQQQGQHPEDPGPTALQDTGARGGRARRVMTRTLEKAERPHGTHLIT